MGNTDTSNRQKTMQLWFLCFPKWNRKAINPKWSRIILRSFGESFLKMYIKDGPPDPPRLEIRNFPWFGFIFYRESVVFRSGFGPAAVPFVGSCDLLRACWLCINLIGVMAWYGLLAWCVFSAWCTFCYIFDQGWLGVHFVALLLILLHCCALRLIRMYNKNDFPDRPRPQIRTFSWISRLSWGTRFCRWLEIWTCHWKSFWECCRDVLFHVCWHDCEERAAEKAVGDKFYLG